MRWVASAWASATDRGDPVGKAVVVRLLSHDRQGSASRPDVRMDAATLRFYGAV
jgi:hypothetical protein